MSKRSFYKSLTRRDFLKLSSGLVGAVAGSTLLSKAVLQPDEVVQAAPVIGAQRSSRASANAQNAPANLHLVATDGWIYLPKEARVKPYHPDDMAPAPFTTYIFGFRNVTAVSGNEALVYAQKEKAQLSAPLFYIDEYPDDGSTEGFTLKLTNLGLQLRPDLIDAHTLHFHGFRNAIPIFDGEPHSSVGVPINRELTYFYRPHDPGTYMYHCHFEETEHVHMGMIGPCYVRPLMNQEYPGRKFVYNDLSTEYEREFVLLMSETWTESHWCDSHIQLPEWSDYRPEFYQINGRAYPDTLEPNGGGTDPATGDLIPPVAADGTVLDHLRYQPLSALVQANAGDRVALRMINLGFEEQAMRLEGIKLRVVGKDATLLRGRNGADLSYLTNTVAIGPGESVDAIFVAPEHSGGSGYDRYLFYNRNYARLNNGGYTGFGGQMTEVRVYPAGHLPAQIEPNT